MTSVDDEFTAFVNREGLRSLRLAVLLMGEVAAGQDLLQSVHEQLYRHWRWHGAPDDPGAYARKALANAAAKQWRRPWHHREVLTTDFTEMPATVGHPEALLRQHLLPALRRLPPGQRSTIVLRYFADYTEAETAQALGCSIGTVKTQASRALRRLRQDPALTEIALLTET